MWCIVDVLFQKGKVQIDSTGHEMHSCHSTLKKMNNVSNLIFNVLGPADATERKFKCPATVA